MTLDPDTTPPRPETSEVAAYRLAQVEKRLKEGAGTFAAVRTSIEALDKRITDETRFRPWKLVAAGVALLGTAAGLLVAIGEYRATAQHTTDTVRETAKEIDVVKSEVRSIDTSQKLLRQEVEAVKAATARIEDKLEEPRRDALGRRRSR